MGTSSVPGALPDIRGYSTKKGKIVLSVVGEPEHINKVSKVAAVWESITRQRSRE